MNRKDVGAGIDESFDIGIDRGHHQVDVEGLLTMRTQRLHDIWANRDIGHEMPVHDVNMNVVSARGVDGADLLTQTGEVSGKNGRSDTNRLLHELYLVCCQIGCKRQCGED